MLVRVASTSRYAFQMQGILQLCCGVPGGLLRMDGCRDLPGLARAAWDHFAYVSRPRALPAHDLVLDMLLEVYEITIGDAVNDGETRQARFLYPRAKVGGGRRHS